jgi:protein involved in sex pheromone biosynthesis|tara:strand:+ start:188 stop:394 length:207 start_codon:yes stop_codon:yes gene_type:complete
MSINQMKKFLVCSLVMSSLILAACNPTVKVEAPDEPITINMNIKIEHEVRIKVDKELDDVFADDSGLF